MFASFLVALLVAVIIAGLLIWLCVWSESRSRRESEAYWTSQKLHCSHCDSDYPRDVETREWSAFGRDLKPGSSFICTEEEPEFDGFCEQPRRCLECSEPFSGLTDSACPACNSVTRELAEDLVRE